MTDPASTNPSEDPVQALEAEVQQAIDLCNGDLRAALRATVSQQVALLAAHYDFDIECNLTAALQGADERENG
jgi:microcystin degradation protein MlrC